MREDIGRKETKKEDPKKVETQQQPKPEQQEKPKDVAESFEQMDQMAKSDSEGSPQTQNTGSQQTLVPVDQPSTQRQRKGHRKYSFRKDAAIICEKCGQKMHTEAQLAMHLRRKDHAN